MSIEPAKPIYVTKAAGNAWVGFREKLGIAESLHDVLQRRDL